MIRRTIRPDTVAPRSRNGDREAVKVRLGRAAKVNGQDKNKSSPRHLSAAKVDREAVAIFLISQADIEASNATGDTALYLGGGNGHMETISSDETNTKAWDQKGYRTLHIAAEKGERGILELRLVGGGKRQ